MTAPTRAYFDLLAPGVRHLSYAVLGESEKAKLRITAEDGLEITVPGHPPTPIFSRQELSGDAYKTQFKPRVVAALEKVRG